MKSAHILILALLKQAGCQVPAYKTHGDDALVFSTTAEQTVTISYVSAADIYRIITKNLKTGTRSTTYDTAIDKYLAFA